MIVPNERSELIAQVAELLTPAIVERSIIVIGEGARHAA